MEVSQFSGRLVKPSEVAKFARVTSQTVLTWFNEGRLPGVRLSDKCFRIHGDALINFLSNGIEGGAK